METPSPVIRSQSDLQEAGKPKSSTCSNCKTSFNLMKRKHHCHQCERLLCSNCLPNKMHGERVCAECVVFTDVLVKALAEGFEDVFWIHDETNNLWEPVQVLETELVNPSENEADKNVVIIRVNGVNYGAADRSRLFKKPQLMTKAQIQETIKHIVRTYINLSKDSGIKKGGNVTLIGDDNRAAQSQVEKVLYKDGMVHGVLLQGAQGEAVIPIEKFQMQIISHGALDMENRIIELVDEYERLRTGLRVKVEDHLMRSYQTAKNEWDENYSRQKIQEGLMNILIDSYHRMEACKEKKYQQLAEILSLPYVSKDLNKEAQHQELDKLVQGYLFRNRKALITEYASAEVNTLFDAAANKLIILTEDEHIMRQFVAECCRVAWEMQLISPKVTLLPSTCKPEEKSEDEIPLGSNDYERMPGSDINSSKILYYVWPALAWKRKRVQETRVYCVMRDTPFPQKREEQIKPQVRQEEPVTQLTTAEVSQL